MIDNLPVLFDFKQSIDDATGQLSERSQRIYINDAKVFASWLHEQGLTIKELTRSHIIAYRAYLASTHAKATAARMLSVARRILDEQVITGNISANPAQKIKGFKLDDESPHIALTKQQAIDLLASIDRKEPSGIFHYALIYLLLRTGIRRSECAALNIGDFSKEQGHTVMTVKHGKGDKRRKVKVPAEVFRAIEKYIEISNRSIHSLSEPLFVNPSKRWKGQRITDKYIERIVSRYGSKINIELTPHDLRASFITLAIEGGATLTQAQYAAGHKDPRTTERYQQRKVNLDNNAVDYIHL